MTVAQQLADGGVVLRETVPSSDVVRARFGDVDGLRALAVVAIVAFQTVRFIGLPARTPPAVAQLFGDASQGFALFLMLSAFSLAYPILAASRTDGATYLDIGRYAVKRLLRIYPAFLTVLGVALAIHPLAAALHSTALANAVPAIPVSTVLRNAVFLDGGFGGFADGAGNDGFTALALVARGFILLPLALYGWLRAPRVTVAAAILAAALDVLTPAHAFTLSAVLPLVLGIVAADLRVQHHRLQRFGLPLALGAAVAAFFLEPYLAVMAGTIAAPDALRVDPVWSIALFGLLAAAGFSGRLEAALGFPPLRLLGAAAYGISLVAMPVAALATRTLPERFSFGALAASTAAEEFGAGIVLWLAVDRWFAGDALRRRAADGPGAWLDRILAKCHASRLVFAAPASTVSEEAEPTELRVVPPPATFYAPPPRPAAEIPVFSTRTGSADDLAAEILQTKARLGELSAAVLDPEPRPAPPDTDPYAKPGFYRRPPQTVTSSGARLTTTTVAAAPPSAVSAVAATPLAVAPVAVMTPVATTPIAVSPPPVETPPAGNGRAEALPSIDETRSSPAAVAPATATASAATTATAETAVTATIATEPEAAAEIPPFHSEREEVSAVHTPLPARHAAAPFETAMEAPPAATSGAFEPAPTLPIADLVSDTPAVSAPVEVRPNAGAPVLESLPDAARGDVPIREILARAVETVPEPPAVAAATIVASADVRSSSLESQPANPVDVFGTVEPALSGWPATPQGSESIATGPAIPAQPFPSSYDGESPLEMLRAAYPPIDESPALEPETTTIPASDRTEPPADRYEADLGSTLPPSEEAARSPHANEPPPEEFRLHRDAESSSSLEPSAELLVTGLTRATPPAAPDDRSAHEIEASAAHVPLAPLTPATFPEPAIELDRPDGVAILRPVVKASLLVRVFKHARAKFKPVAGSAPGIPASPPSPSGLQPVAAGRDASQATSDVAEPQATRPVMASNAPPRATASAPAKASPGRPSIRMRIGPSARISHPDGDHG